MARQAALLPLLCLASVSCLGLAQTGEDAVESTEEELAGTPENAIVLDRDELRRSDQALIEAIQSNIPSVHVNIRPRSSDHCPRLSLRGPLTESSYSNPLVYVNGTRMINTCILSNLRTGELEQVEVYPAGFTPRTGYVTHPHGLILVFSRRI